jgi:quercetin 2,3-dioxygenase
VGNILRYEETPWGGNPHFQIQVIQPERAFGNLPFSPHRPLTNDTGLGPLQLVMHCYLKDIHIPMHEHRNDEIMSYLYTGSMKHKDSVGQEAIVSPNHIMMMNAGRSFYHEETSEACEALQILIRPEKEGLVSGVQFYEREMEQVKGWQLLGGPTSTDAPLTIRNQVVIYDARFDSNQHVEVPKYQQFTPWLYVMDGELQVGDATLKKGDAIAGHDLYEKNLTTMKETTLVLFLADEKA